LTTPTSSPTETDAANSGETILELSGVSKAFVSPDGSPLPVLDNISFKLREGEIVALLGRSGSGKSTLLRCIAGLMAPSSGQVFYRGKPVKAANPGVALVFQSFALLPWLTVQKNVEIGLEARGVAPAERHDRATRVLDRIGLDGFESAYPKELSGGMRQRVGFARALVVEPDALLMDEPFSALDVLTAANLRSRLVQLWDEPDFPTKAMLIVTHNIEEAVTLADRILILGTNPGHIRTEISCAIPRPRDRGDEACQNLVNEIYAIMTGSTNRVPSHVWSETPAADASPTEVPLPAASVGGMAGLLEILAAHGGREDLPKLAQQLIFEPKALLPVIDAAQLLGLAKVDDADIELTVEGRSFAAGDIDTCKAIFARQAKARAPLVRTICNSLESTKDGTLDESFFLDLLHSGFSQDEARQQLDRAIDWGRYAELFDYDAKWGTLKLERPVAKADGQAASSVKS
jgi:NitT/TauT family transport system ATP-binding protein